MPKMNIAESGMQKYFDHIKADYYDWQLKVHMAMAPASMTRDRAMQDSIAKFNTGLSYKVGLKYIKIINNHTGMSTVHSFVVNDLTNKFPLGSILKAASWKAPAMNFIRGCVLKEIYSGIRWTGA